MNVRGRGEDDWGSRGRRGDKGGGGGRQGLGSLGEEEGEGRARGERRWGETSGNLAPIIQIP